MHAVAFHAIRAASRPVPRRACRVVAGVRYSICLRSFHQSPRTRRDPKEERENDEGQSDSPTESTKSETGNGSGDIEVKDGTEALNPTIDEEASTLIPRARKGRIGASGRLKGNQRRQLDGLPPVALPGWFFDKNVKLLEESPQTGSLTVHGTPRAPSIPEDTEAKDAAVDAGEERIPGYEIIDNSQDAKYSMHADIYKEILLTLRAGLLIQPPKSSENLDIIRPITLLDCPKDGGAFYLDSIVETIATTLQADLIRLDAQDLAYIVGPYVDENVAWTHSSTALLGYEAHKFAGQMEEYDEDPNASAVPPEEDDDTRANSKLPEPLLKIVETFVNNKRKPPRPKNSVPLSGALQVGFYGIDQNQQSTVSDSEQWNNLKYNAISKELVSAADAKRSASQPEPDTLVPVSTIVQIKDYKALSGTSQGKDLIQRIRTAINQRWKDGKNIICVGTDSSEDQRPGLSRPNIQHLQADVVEGEKSTIFVPPGREPAQDNSFEADEKSRIRNINIRNVKEMISKLADGSSHLKYDIDLYQSLDDETVEESGIDNAVWTYPKVRRLATTIIGFGTDIGRPTPLTGGPQLVEALKILRASDEAKFQWGNAERIETVEIEEETSNEIHDNKNTFTKDKLKNIKKKCDSYEKKLLSGVVWPADIRTTFDQIRAPKETVEALKTLTSLSLQRPEAFSYGVLATDKIPGLLLYGPPGTGKTLLAKAVAKESGATVLEVSGADVNDMFVGEGEKNVKAIFSLAKKLSPCVVFIDEADGIFSARGDTRTGRNNAHRDVINQFLREWDGMNDMSAFIMVATNRPFDLDEAVFRRLPRRLLVDLPVEKDREAILKIHLKDEILDESVSLSKIAKETPFYSGSDLKNVSVAAALACIREENDAAAKHTGDESYKYPEKRILTKAHFDKALEEISASISEDMGTLSAIRKFDEKYGDRKGRRKKSNALGFGGTKTVERDSESARVRKMEA